ncbi:hypothetical protein JCM10207_007583 [Rhodosporidiobolus poonsookiae]
MALAPQFVTHRIGHPGALHTLEVFLDIICPFSGKQWKGIEQHVLPLLEKNNELQKSLQIIIRQVPQSWHSSSTLVHEAALGVSKTLVDAGASFQDDDVGVKFRTFFSALIDPEQQKAFYDEPTAVETPNQTRERLADFAAKTVGVDREAFLKAISVSKGNSGTSVTNDLKLQVKYHRTRGIHVTPTVALDGLVEPSISSSFSGEDWQKFLQEKILPPGSKL